MGAEAVDKLADSSFRNTIELADATSNSATSDDDDGGGGGSDGGGGETSDDEGESDGGEKSEAASRPSERDMSKSRTNDGGEPLHFAESNDDEDADLSSTATAITTSSTEKPAKQTLFPLHQTIGLLTAPTTQPPSFPPRGAANNRHFRHFSEYVRRMPPRNGDATPAVVAAAAAGIRTHIVDEPIKAPPTLVAMANDDAAAIVDNAPVDWSLEKTDLRKRIKSTLNIRRNAAAANVAATKTKQTRLPLPPPSARVSSAIDFLDASPELSIVSIFAATPPTPPPPPLPRSSTSPQPQRRRHKSGTYRSRAKHEKKKPLETAEKTLLQREAPRPLYASLPIRRLNSQRSMTRAPVETTTTTRNSLEVT